MDGRVCDVFEVAKEFGRDTEKIIQEVGVWIQLGVMEWVDDRVTFKLAPPPPQEPEIKKEACRVLCREQRRGLEWGQK